MVRGATELTGDRVSASARAVLDVVDAIPEGWVLSYGDVAALSDDQLPLLRGLGLGGARQALRQHSSNA